MKRLVLRGFAAAVLVGTCATSTAYASSIVYSQPPTGGNYRTSETAGGVPIWRTYDNFTLDSTYDLIGVNWWGAYAELVGALPPAPDSTAFEFRFYGDAAGAPGALLYSATTSNFDSSFLFTGTVGGEPASFYQFSALLPAAFTAVAGTPYWLSIISHSPSFGPVVWAWAPGVGGDGIAFQDFVSTGARGTYGDRSFELIATPEPTSLLLLGAGLGAVGARLRRRARG